MAVVILKNGNPAVWVHDANLGQDGRAGHPAVGNDAVDAVTFDSGGHQNRLGRTCALLVSIRCWLTRYRPLLNQACSSGLGCSKATPRLYRHDPMRSPKIYSGMARATAQLASLPIT